MPQTKHAVVFFGLAVLVSVGTPILGSVFNASNSGMTASVQTALNPDTPVVLPQVATTDPVDGKESAREGILAELGNVDREVVDTETPPILEEPEEEISDVIEPPVLPVLDTTPRVVSVPEKGALYACESTLKNPVQNPTFIKNGVTSSVIEGARVIVQGLDVGVTPDASSTPIAEPVLQLPQIPQQLGNPRCVAQGVIGVTQAGMLIESGEAYTGFPSRNTEGIFGYARDGFGIFGAKENGETVKTEDLDECHGHTHQIFWDGQLVTMYHYHVTDEFPYTVGCFRAQPLNVVP